MKKCKVPLLALIAGSLPTSSVAPHLKTSTRGDDMRLVATEAQYPVENVFQTIGSVAPKLRDAPPTQLSIRKPFPVTDSHWSHRLRKRFKELAVKEALGTITFEEAAELERLDAKRDRIISSVNGREVLRRIEQQTATTALISALERYVRIAPKPSNKSRKQAQG